MSEFDFKMMEAAELAGLIEYHDRRYWELNSPEISDADYDRLVEALRSKAPDHPLLSRVNAVTVSGNGKVHHREPMLSLDKAYSLEALLEWAGKYARSADELLLVEPKYDGISAGFDGRILSTRGDGENGENISDKLPLIELETPGHTGKVDRPVRGEIIIRNDDFKELYCHIRKKDGGTYKNSRNAVAGIMGLKDISEIMMQGAKLTLVDYNLISIKVKFSELSGRWENLKEELAVLPYPMDGIVLKIADNEYRRSLGATSHHPRGEIAYKFTNLSSSTTLLGVEWSFGKNCLTPVALLEPVELSGITIKRASLHNAQNIEDMQIMIGDTVTVERAGDVIPYISACTPGSHRSSPWISDCPSCSTALVRRGPELCCPNPECPEGLLRNLLASVRSFGVEHLGEPTLRKLIRRFNIRHLHELLLLDEEQLLKLDGFQRRSAANLANELRRSCHTTEANIIASLNIPNVGLNIASMLLAKADLAQLRRMNAEELAAISGIGPERAAATVSVFASEAAEIDQLLAITTIKEANPVDGGQETVCFTGKMPEKRSFYEELARQAGMRPVDSVTSSLSLLVTADTASASSKMKTAAKLNIPVISLDEFLSRCNGRDNSSQETPDFSAAWAKGELF